MLKVYGKEGCSKCDMVKNILNKRNIEHKYYKLEEIENREEILDIIELDNQGRYPLIIDGDNVLTLKVVLSNK